MNNKALMFVLSGVMMLIIFTVGIFLFKDQQVKKMESTAMANSDVFVREHSQTYGVDSAKVTIIEFMDPGCETCRVFAPFVKSAVDTYPDKIKIVIRYAPLHEGADQMVKILEAAAMQDRYWETLQVMYDTQQFWASHSDPQPQYIWNFLSKTDLDIDKLKKDMNSPAIAKLIQQDIADAKTLNVTKTPGFFVNGKPLVTFGYNQLRALIESELAVQYPDYDFTKH